MGLKCSVLGHKYGEATVEREREEQGSEVVITIQERETCERCGHTRIVSENKEVTSIETPADIAGDLVEDEESGPDATAERPAESEATDGTAESEEPGEPVDDENESADPASETPVDAEPTPVQEEVESAPADPASEDAEIIEDSPVESGDSELDEPTTGVDVPDAEGTSSMPEAEPTEDDGVIIDGDEPEKRERAPGEWPEEPGDDGDDWKPETVPTDDDETSPVEPIVGKTVPDGKFRCPECGFTTDVESSSLRAGDFCPECHKGSLVQDAGE